MTKREILAYIRARAAALEADGVHYQHIAYFAASDMAQRAAREKMDFYKAQADALYSVAIEIEDGLTDAELFAE